MNTFSPAHFPKIALLAAPLLFAACAHNHSDDYRRADYSSRKALKSHYDGWNQLTEMDVLGLAKPKSPTDADIARALDRSSNVELKAGDTVLVLQSGESVPDPRMVNELNKHYRAVPFSGVRSDWARKSSDDPEDHYARSLRYAAAQAGAQKILCFWGSLEVSKHDLSTKTITWLPVVDVIVPDQKDQVRVHLKVALVDVRSGAWTVFRTEPLQAQVISTGWGREHLEPSEVKALKQKSYVVAVDSLLTGKQ